MEISKKGRSVSLQVMFWWVPEEGSIHVATNDPEAESFHVAVRPDPSKPSGQPYLFRELSKCLRKMGAPAPPEEAD